MPYQFIRLSEHLDMLGVELFATPTQTRKSNGDRLQSVIKNIIGSWQAGRFMPLIQRPWSVNSYALSKLWYKCNCIDLRVQDYKGIHSKVLSWIYSDQLEKPESIILFRPIESGGLGLHHVALKAKSMLIRSFLDTAINPDYINSLYHNALFRFYVLKETDFADPGSSPYYSEDFFKTIVAANENPQLNIIKMSSKQWYEFLLEKEIKYIDNESQELNLIKCRTEQINAGIEWERVWRLARLKGLGPELKTFAWRLLHGILPIRTRLNRILSSKNLSTVCQLCEANEDENLQHAFIHCNFNQDFGLKLVQNMKSIDADMNVTDVLTLNIHLDGAEAFPYIWFACKTLYCIWNARVDKSRRKILSIRSDLEASANILRKTRSGEEDGIIRILISTM